MEMTGVVIVIVMAVIFVWGAVSARLERADLSAPIVFVTVGAVLAALSLVDAKAAPVEGRQLPSCWRCSSSDAHPRVVQVPHDLRGRLDSCPLTTAPPDGSPATSSTDPSRS